MPCSSLTILFEGKLPILLTSQIVLVEGVPFVYHEQVLKLHIEYSTSLAGNYILQRTRLIKETKINV